MYWVGEGLNEGNGVMYWGNMALQRKKLVLYDGKMVNLCF
jgi:hypothetical protein